MDVTGDHLRINVLEHKLEILEMQIKGIYECIKKSENSIYATSELQVGDICYFRGYIEDMFVVTRIYYKAEWIRPGGIIKHVRKKYLDGMWGNGETFVGKSDENVVKTVHSIPIKDVLAAINKY